VSNNDKVRAMAETAKRATERGAKLTGQLLTFSRTSNIDLKAVDVVALMQGMRDIITVSLGSTIQFVTRFEEAQLWTQADANQLELAILNLAINARDAMPGGGTLEVRVEQRMAPDSTLDPGAYVVAEFIDTGAGIPADVISRVFDPFFTTKPIGKGTGLGLSQVYGITRQAGGTARVMSEEGHGTTVQLWLPLREPIVLESEAIPEVEQKVQGGERILVIEDDTEVRAMLVESLKMLGYMVTEAESGRAGLDRLPDDQPDLLLVDFAMPGMNGIDVISEAREVRDDLPVILATGYADVDVSRLAVRHCSILRKPFQLDELARTVRLSLKG
jgi:CheY-like chemotaxis protein/two-component sensor histidine kinase